MAVCTEDSHDHDPHCYHAHFLIFPGAQDVSSAARSYFSKMQSFRELGSAMSHAANQGEYVLISPAPDCFNIFSGPLNIPRQFARFLVAHKAGSLHLADWRNNPNWLKAEAISASLKPLFQHPSLT